MSGNHEMMLVANNIATCTGDKDGDGEAIVTDANRNTLAFTMAQTVLDGTATTVTVAGPLQAVQNGQSVNIADYYLGHWIQLAAGRGVGQVRRIASYVIDPSTQYVTFTVSPAWDVPPAASSTRLTVSRQAWQLYVVDNTVDNRAPTCLKSNRTRPRAGLVGFDTTTADSSIAGNRQYDSDGLFIQQGYDVTDPACAECKGARASFQNFVDIRGNTIDGEYAWSSDCSHSGFLGSVAAGPAASSPPPVTSFGVSLAYNFIRRADATRGGGISLAPTWYQGPPPYDWKMVDGMLIHHNTLTDLSGPVPPQQCDNKYPARIGINIYTGATIWNTVLYANACPRVSLPLSDTGHDTVRVCPSTVTDSCECP
jgi:hypothetical protein